jgi:hypothetical protein
MATCAARIYQCLLKSTLAHTDVRGQDAELMFLFTCIYLPASNSRNLFALSDERSPCWPGL